MRFWYVLFVKTACEHKTVNEINTTWKIDGLIPFIPMKDTKFKIRGEVTQEKHPLFPGYIFIETEIADIEFMSATRQLIAQSPNILKLLSYYIGIYAMKIDEQQTLIRLYNPARCVEMSRGFIEGDHIIIIDGPLSRCESRIKKINRHRMQAVIEIEMMGSLREVIVGLEIIRKV
jgi:transcriptional antiterminator NusG